MVLTVGVAVFSERGDHGLVAFLHDEKPTAQPQQEADDTDQTQAKAGTLHVGLKRSWAASGRFTARTHSATAFAATKQAVELAVEVTP